ncbi:MAG: EamA family transporter [Rudaea sp.]
MYRPVLLTLLAAVLFGASTPLAKRLLGEVPPVLLAGVLYAGSGVGLALVLAVRWRVRGRTPGILALLRGRDAAWLAAAILSGGVLGPIALMLGLALTTASTAALLLNLEPVFTALLAWSAFREHFDRRIALGMASIVAGGLVLSAGPGRVAAAPGALLVASACLCWAIDNNCTRNVAEGDAIAIACIKGLVAGIANVVLAMTIGAAMPPWPTLAAGALVGVLGYGASLALFVVGLRELGTARTGAYFSIAPFVGAGLALLIQGDPMTASLGVAAALMGFGVWLHVTEKHSHAHVHEPIEHTHRHLHDEHHLHAHTASDPAGEPHEHAHVHAPIRHAHSHFPDIHHRHRH